MCTMKHLSDILKQDGQYYYLMLFSVFHPPNVEQHQAKSKNSSVEDKSGMGPNWGYEDTPKKATSSLTLEPVMTTWTMKP